ncbi:hypothetical protein NDU88_002324, partial [Pleurodeles waltl]
AQQSLKKMFNLRVFARAGRGRSRFAGRAYYNQGSRGTYNSSYQEFRPQFYPQRARGFRSRGYGNSRNTNQTGKSILLSYPGRRSSLSFFPELVIDHLRSLGCKHNSRLYDRILL